MRRLAGDRHLAARIAEVAAEDARRCVDLGCGRSLVGADHDQALLADAHGARLAPGPLDFGAQHVGFAREVALRDSGVVPDVGEPRRERDGALLA